MKNKINEIIEESIRVKRDVQNNLINDINIAAELIIDCFNHKKKILVCGNGGSAADAQHFAGELVGRFTIERDALPCISLTTNTSTITAWSNDYDYDTIFQRQVQAFGEGGDILIGISTSGNSKNVIKSIEKARDIGIKSIALLGCNGGEIKKISDFSIIVKSNNTPRIQEAHIMILHIVCEIIEKRLFETNHI